MNKFSGQSQSESNAVLSYAASSVSAGPLQTLRPLAWVAFLLAIDRALEYGWPLAAQLRSAGGRSVDLIEMRQSLAYLFAGALTFTGGVALLAHRRIGLSFLYYGELIAFGLKAFLPVVVLILDVQQSGLEVIKPLWKQVDEWGFSLIHYYLIPVALPLTVPLLCRSARQKRVAPLISA